MDLTDASAVRLAREVRHLFQAPQPGGALDAETFHAGRGRVSTMAAATLHRLGYSMSTAVGSVLIYDASAENKVHILRQHFWSRIDGHGVVDFGLNLERLPAWSSTGFEAVFAGKILAGARWVPLEVVLGPGDDFTTIVNSQESWCTSQPDGRAIIHFQANLRPISSVAVEMFMGSVPSGFLSHTGLTEDEIAARPGAIRTAIDHLIKVVDGGDSLLRYPGPEAWRRLLKT